MKEHLISPITLEQFREIIKLQKNLEKCQEEEVIQKEENQDIVNPEDNHTMPLQEEA